MSQRVGWQRSAQARSSRREIVAVFFLVMVFPNVQSVVAQEGPRTVIRLVVSEESEPIESDQDEEKNLAAEELVQPEELVPLGIRIVPTPPSPQLTDPRDAAAVEAEPQAQSIPLKKTDPKLRTLPFEISQTSQPEEEVPVEELPAQPEPAEPEPTPLERDILLRAANNAVALGNLEEAVRRYQELLEQFPKDVEARRLMAGVMIQLERLEAAAEQYRLLIEQTDGQAIQDELVIDLADVLIQLRSYPEAAELLQQQLAANPDDAKLAVKLAQVYAFNQQFRRGYEVYQQYLSDLDDKDPGNAALLAPLLLDLQRPAEAVRYFLRLRQIKPEDLLLATNTARAFHELGDQVRVLELVNEIASLDPENIELRLKLGEALIAPESKEAGLMIFSQVVAQDPENLEAKLGQVRIYLKSYEPHLARPILQSIPPSEHKKEYLLALAAYHTVMGEYADAAVVYRTLLRDHPDDVEVYIGLGDNYYDAGEFEQAKQYYLRALSIEPSNRAARFRLARNYTDQRFFPEAEALLLELLEEDPNNLEAIRQYLEVLIQTHRAPQAEAYLLQRRAEGNLDIRHRLEIHLGLGRVFLEMNRGLDALYEYRAAVQLPAGVQPEALYGIYASLKLLEGYPHAKQVLMGHLVGIQGDYARIVIGDLASRDCQHLLAFEMFQEVLHFSPENIAARFRLGEVQQRNPDNNPVTLQTYQSVLHASPSNIRARLGVARVLVSMREYPAAEQAYHVTIATMSTSLTARRELARLLHDRYGASRAARVYHAASQTAAVEEITLGGPKLSMPARPPMTINPSLSPLGTTTNGSGLPNSLHTPQNGYGGGNPRSGPGPAPRYQAGGSLAGPAITTEQQAKKYKDWRPFQAIPLFHGALDAEPINTHAWFELAQTYSSVNKTHAAIDTYQKLLEVDPCHREACIALNRNIYELKPQLRLDMDYFDQSGRDGLARISRFRFGPTAILPLGDEDEFVSAGYRHAIYDPENLERVLGNFFQLGGQKRIHGPWSAYGQLNVELFDEFISTRPTFNAGVRYRTEKNCLFSMGAVLENVVENEGSIQQDIYRYGLEMSANWKPYRRWEMDAYYRFLSYSDNNDFNNFGFDNNFLVLMPPRQLSVDMNYRFWGFADQTIFDPIDPTNVVQAIHPYFAPQAFSQVELALEWKHWLSHDSFKGANQWWYSIRGGGQWDSDGEYYSMFEVKTERDLKPWFSVGAGYSLLRSRFYDNDVVFAYGVARFR